MNSQKINCNLKVNNKVKKVNRFLIESLKSLIFQLVEKQMQPKMYNDTNSQMKHSPYSTGNSFHMNKSVEKANTISSNNSNISRGNYHYNYSPALSNKALLQRRDNSIEIKNKQSSYKQFNQLQQQKQHYKRLQNSQTESQPSYKKYAVSESKHNLEKSTHNLSKQIFNFTQSMFPNTFKLLDLKKFIQYNLALRKRLLNEINQIRQRKGQIMQNKGVTNGINYEISRPQTPNRMTYSRQKSTNFYKQTNKNQNIQQSHMQQEIQYFLMLKQQKQTKLQEQKQQLSQIQKKNVMKKEQIQKLQSQILHQSIHETPLLRQKQQLIQYLSVEVEWLNQKNSHLKKLTNSNFAEDNIFEMYEKMCRQCETLRKNNNKKSQKLKTLFEKTNKLTGKQENVNMFLMNLKV